MRSRLQTGQLEALIDVAVETGEGTADIVRQRSCGIGGGTLIIVDASSTTGPAGARRLMSRIAWNLLRSDPEAKLRPVATGERDAQTPGAE